MFAVFSMFFDWRVKIGFFCFITVVWALVGTVSLICALTAPEPIDATQAATQYLYGLGFVVSLVATFYWGVASRKAYKSN